MVRIPQPQTGSPYYPFWERCNKMVKAWIINSLTIEIAISVMSFPTAKEVWQNINDIYGQSNESRYIQIQREISASSQGASDIASYFTKMRSLRDELTSAYVGPACSYGALPKFIEDQHMFQFLSGLNDSYSTVKSSILLMIPLPSISKAYFLLQQNESQKDYCKKPRHTVDKCYRLHDFPTEFKFTKNKRVVACAQVEEPTAGILAGPRNPSDSMDFGLSKEK
ncbi:uncharacterized protein [Nicotiana tomentosiformis]|uniref:uncharacterized protein n=1 Tax=Nicotiana tomentosiformis TaxID=4098 RepID=UPI00388CE823